MTLHLIVGSGAIGSVVARKLLEQGDDVRVVTRSGTGPDGAERVAADASDADRMAALAAGASAIHNCVNPPYHRWVTDWPPIANALLGAAERSGAVLVTLSNLYGYGPVDAPMTEDTPLAATGTKGRVRAAMWRAAKAAHDTGRIRAAEARASDFYGPAVISHLGDRFVPRVLAGRRPQLVQGDPAVPHSWTYVDDVATTLITLATDERAWGRPWHVPTDRAVSAAAVAARIAAIAGVPDPGVQVLPPIVVRMGGLFVPLLREMAEVRYQFTDPFVLDSSAAQATFGLAPTPLDDGLAATVAWWRSRQRAAA
ncbi:NAD-dependent epimerase/dehydratase family protein [Pseudonocardia sp. GCM10023141]|uniref:NAD-dependent epimerase/dehydratase family protein n=1 Tax=Pseudonocardia sp. GCM10023141 TaxID=3252653 RepID=UPI0036226BB2